MTTPLAALTHRGQSIWLDFISRELLTSGELERMIREDHITGLTSNPTIFAKAIRHGSDYDDEIKSAMDRGLTSAEDVFTEIAIADIRKATQILSPVHEKAGGKDGFVSLEVSPALADDTERTLRLARELWKRVDARNLMIKVPATDEGIPAIRQLIADGINVNVTLIFSLASYVKVVDAYMSGLEDRAKRGESLNVHSVASFFVSRVDTAVDPLLEAAGKDAAPLLGEAAIANARRAYELFDKEFLRGERFRILERKGAHVQRPLWASTSAKNPAYRDVVYAEALVGPHTVDTMPPETIKAFSDHGVADSDTVTSDWDGANANVAELAKFGVDIDKVTDELLAKGVSSFAASYAELLDAIATKMDLWGEGFSERTHWSPGAMGDDVTRDLGSLAPMTTLRRILERDPSVWTSEKGHDAVISNRLGWLDVIDTMKDQVGRLATLATSLRAEGYRDCVLLGMGGSSLCPEVFRNVFPTQDGALRLFVLDTTDPSAIEEVTSQISLPHTLFVVSSKSGGTLETLSQFAHFHELEAKLDTATAGRHFVAVTDPGSPLATIAAENSFRDTFINPQDIGGRYSALSFFGLVPAALMGVDVRRILDVAGALLAASGVGNPGHYNPGLFLGTVFGRGYEVGRDKITILAPSRLATFGLWAEQLIAESTGKEGKGIVPIAGEEPGAPAVYSGNDRLFVAYHMDDSSQYAAGVSALIAAGQPVMEITLRDSYDLGGEFIRWELATAVAATHLHTDPFDEPNVKESKDNTNKILAQHEAKGAFPAEPQPVSSHPVADQIDEFLKGAAAPHYVALMAYVTPTAPNDVALHALQAAIRDRWHIATTVGFGPRFLHSTGQLHKGGPNTGLYIQFTTNDTCDVSIPGKPFSFSTLKKAQALGDLDSLLAHGRKVIHIEIPTSNEVAKVMTAAAEQIATPSGTAARR